MLIIHDYLISARVLSKIGIETSDCVIEDPRCAAWLLQPDITTNLILLIRTYIPDFYNTKDLLDDKFIESESYYIIHLMRLLRLKLEDVGLSHYFKYTEMPMHRSLYKIESHGFHFDRIHFQEIQDVFNQRIKKLENDANNLCGGGPVPWDDSKRMFNLIFKTLKIPHPDGNADDQKKSIPKEMLIRIDDESEFPMILLERMRLTKTAATFIHPILESLQVDEKLNAVFYTQDPFTVRSYISFNIPTLGNWKNCYS